MAGDEVACRLHSPVLSCRQSGIDPESYIEGVLGALSTTPDSQMATLTPWGLAARTISTR